MTPPFVSAWRPLAPMRLRVPTPLLSWLSDETSLTRRLRSACRGCFSVHVLQQYRANPDADEARALGMRRGVRALIREVYLMCGDTPWVYARTIIPPATTRVRPRLARLGTRSLGSTLFADPTLTRGGIEVIASRPGDTLYSGYTGHTGMQADAAPVWGRRSVFSVRGRPLLVSEFFLAALLREAA